MRRIGLVVAILAVLKGSPAWCSDWPQFMRNPEHTGDAAEEAITLPLGLSTWVKLNDAILASPAVVGNRVYVVDQMGTAYCVDPAASRVLWKTSPDGERARGGNTSSPCVANGRLYYATTAGSLHILDAHDGRVVRSVALDSPVTGSVTLANDRLYFQTLDARVIALDLEGNQRWHYEHYLNYKDPGPQDAGPDPKYRGNKKSVYYAHACDQPQFGGGEVAVSGKRLVVNLGWDIFCLEDADNRPRLAWCRRVIPDMKIRGPGFLLFVPMGPAIRGEWVYCGLPGIEIMGSVLRLRLADGQCDPARDMSSAAGNDAWAIYSTVAVRGEICFAQSHFVGGMRAHDFGKGRALWSAYTGNAPATPGLASVALSRDHCVFATLRGELYVVALESKGAWGKGFQPAPFIFQTPTGKIITSAPAVSGGRIYFGSDDGYLYGLGTGGSLQAGRPELFVHKPRGKCVPATGKRYAWPSSFGTQANTCFADDPGLKPPFRLRWAIRSGGQFYQPLSASEDDIFALAQEGMLMAVEQGTGRIRWRQRLDSNHSCGAGLLYADGRLYVPRPKANASRGACPEARLYCLDAADGSEKWSAPIGANTDSFRTAPVLADGVVAYATRDDRSDPKQVDAVLRAYDAKTGAPQWKLSLGEFAGTNILRPNVAGCVQDGIMYFSFGGWDNQPGATWALEPKTGKVLWRNTQQSISNRGGITASQGRIFLGGRGVSCLNADNGSLLWRNQQLSSYSSGVTLGAEFFTVRSYAGQAYSYSLKTGQPLPPAKPTFIGATYHTCGPVVFTPNLVLAMSVGGLDVRDAKNGKELWKSSGFGPRACANPVLASGRIFYCPTANGMLYCWDPDDSP